MLRRILPFCLTGLLVACGGSASSDTAAPDTAATTSTPSTAATTNAPAGASPATSDTAAAGSAPATAAPDVVVPAALQLTAPLVGGGEIELDAYAGRPVLLWFWAPW